LCGTWLNLDKSKNRLIKQKPILVVVVAAAAAAAAGAATAGVVVVVAVVLVCCRTMRNRVEPALTTS